MNLLIAQAQRAMGASTMAGQRPPIDLSSLNLNVPPIPIPGLTPGREAQYTRRIKELEDEVRGLRADNEKQVRSHIFANTAHGLLTAASASDLELHRKL